MSWFRRKLYRTGSVLGDAESVAKGTVPKRIVRKFVWRRLGKWLR